MNWIIPYWLPSTWTSISTTISDSTFLNSAFMISLISAFIGSGAGAWFGAYAAQKIASGAKIREELLADIKNCNAAISLAVLTCNLFLSQKSQHVSKMKKNMMRNLKNFRSAQRYALLASRRAYLSSKQILRLLVQLSHHSPPQKTLYSTNYHYGAGHQH